MKFVPKKGSNKRDQKYTKSKTSQPPPDEDKDISFWDQVINKVSLTSDTIGNYASDVYKETEKTVKNIGQGASSFVDSASKSASELGKNVWEETSGFIKQTSKKTQQVSKNVSETASNLYDETSKKAEQIKNTIEQTTQNVIKKASDTAKETSKIVDTVTVQVFNLGTKLANKVNESPPPKQQKTFWEKILQKMGIGSKINDYAFTRIFTDPKTSFFGGIVSKIYWRIIFGICTIIFVWVISSSILREVRLFLQKNEPSANKTNFNEQQTSQLAKELKLEIKQLKAIMLKKQPLVISDLTSKSTLSKQQIVLHLQQMMQQMKNLIETLKKQGQRNKNPAR